MTSAVTNIDWSKHFIDPRILDQAKQPSANIDFYIDIFAIPKQLKPNDAERKIDEEALRNFYMQAAVAFVRVIRTAPAKPRLETIPIENALSLASEEILQNGVSITRIHTLRNGHPIPLDTRLSSILAAIERSKALISVKIGIFRVMASPRNLIDFTPD